MLELMNLLNLYTTEHFQAIMRTCVTYMYMYMYMYTPIAGVRYLEYES